MKLFGYTIERTHTVERRLKERTDDLYQDYKQRTENLASELEALRQKERALSLENDKLSNQLLTLNKNEALVLSLKILAEYLRDGGSNTTLIEELNLNRQLALQQATHYQQISLQSLLSRGLL